MVTLCSDFLDIKEDWFRLYNIEKVSVFQSYEYNLISWKYMASNSHLAMLVYRDGNNIVKAILPTYIDKQHVLRFINDNSTDICDLIYDRNINLFDVIREIYKYIATIKNIKCVSLENLTFNSPLLPYFKILNGKSIVFSNNELSFLKCTQSPDPVSEFKHLTGDKRKKLKKVLKQTENYPFRIYSFANGDPYPISLLKSIAHDMVKKGGRQKSFFDDIFWNYTKENYEIGILEVAVLFDASDNPISSGFVFVNNTISIRWVILYTESKFNLWNNIRYIDAKGKNATYENNFGRGGYDYKMGNFKPEVSLLYKIIIPLKGEGLMYAWKTVVNYYLKRSFHESHFYSNLSSLKVRLQNIK